MIHHGFCDSASTDAPTDESSARASFGQSEQDSFDASSVTMSDCALPMSQSNSDECPTLNAVPANALSAPTAAPAPTWASTAASAAAPTVAPTTVLTVARAPATVATTASAADCATTLAGSTTSKPAQAARIMPAFAGSMHGIGTTTGDCSCCNDASSAASYKNAGSAAPTAAEQSRI